MNFASVSERYGIYGRLEEQIRRQYIVNWNGIHGISHFRRVREIGGKLVEQTGARRTVVELFAYLHDSRRFNDGADPDHGKRAAKFVRELQGTYYELLPEDLDLLAYACEFHTHGLTEGDVTIQTCWDSDRLDLGRVGIVPQPRKLCTEAAKAPEMIQWAYRQSVSGNLSDGFDVL